MIKVTEAHFAEAVLVGIGEGHKWIDVRMDKHKHLSMYSFRDFLWIYNTKEKKWFATSSANLRLIVPTDIPAELTNEISSRESCSGTSKTSEDKARVEVNSKSRVRSSK